MCTEAITAKIKKINDVLQRKLSIPNYQRPYRWQEEDVRLLLQDILTSWQEGKKSYRVGSVILHKEKNGNLGIVDGQQRITTILLILKILESDLGISLYSDLKFDHNDSKNNIVRNYLYIKDWVKENINNEKKLVFSTYLTEYCEFVEIIVSDLSEAFQMFDSQNGRGKELEPYNLLKAFHIRAMDTETQDTKIECDRRWENATRYKVNKNNEKENPTDILKQVFNEQIYRTRIWSRKEEAYGFNKQRLNEFKGISIDKNNLIKYPFQNILLLQSIANNFFESSGVGVNGIINRFNNDPFKNINPFVQLNQAIINGKSFFDYTETYVEIYNQLFSLSESSNQLIEFKKFYKKYCCDYEGSQRDGDRYIKELYKSLIFLIFDKYGEDGINKYYDILYALVYRVRLNKKQVKYDAIAKFPRDEKLFSTICESNSYFGLQRLETKSKEKIDCKKEVPVIIQFFRNYDCLLETSEKNIILEKYKKEEGNDRIK